MRYNHRHRHRRISLFCNYMESWVERWTRKSLGHVSHNLNARTYFSYSCLLSRLRYALFFILPTITGTICVTCNSHFEILHLSTLAPAPLRCIVSDIQTSISAPSPYNLMSDPWMIFSVSAIELPSEAPTTEGIVWVLLFVSILYKVISYTLIR